MGEIVKNGLIGKMLGLGKSDDDDGAAAESRNLSKIANDRTKSSLQADDAKKRHSRAPKRGRRLLIDKRSTVG